MSPRTVSVDISTDDFFGTLGVMLALGLAAIAVTVVVQFISTWRAAPREKLVNRYALKLNLMVSDDLRPALAQHLAVRVRGGLLGALAAVVTILLLFMPWGVAPIDFGLATSIVSLGSALLFTQVGTIIGGAVARRSMPTGEKVARVQPVGLAELVAPIERRMAAVAAALALGLASLLLIITSAIGSATPPVISASAAPLALVGLTTAALFLLLPVIARRLVARRALLGDAGALAWSDALAAQTLRDLHWFIAAIGGLTAFSALQALGVALPSDATVVTMIWINISGYAGVVGLLLVIAIVLVRSPERHVQRTLWPEFAIVSP